MGAPGITELNDKEAIINCGNCNGLVKVDHAKVELLNAGSFSMIVWAHRTFECSNCKFKIVGAIAGFDPRGLRFTWIPVPPPEEPSNIVKPPTSLII